MFSPLSSPYVKNCQKYSLYSMGQIMFVAYFNDTFSAKNGSYIFKGLHEPIKTKTKHPVQRQAMETSMWPTKSKTSTIWLFLENLCWSLLRERSGGQSSGRKQDWVPTSSKTACVWDTCKSAWWDIKSLVIRAFFEYLRYVIPFSSSIEHCCQKVCWQFDFLPLKVRWSFLPGYPSISPSSVVVLAVPGIENALSTCRFSSFFFLILEKFSWSIAFSIFPLFFFLFYIL